jgi:glutaryl-CoA dehydrogenase
MRDQLTDYVKEIFAKVLAFGKAEILPIANDYWERGEFPFELVPRLAALNFVGDYNLGDYGCTPMTAVANGLVNHELSRIDGSISTFFGVHMGLAVQPINILGSEEQRQRYLPAMARLEKIGGKMSLQSDRDRPPRTAIQRPTARCCGRLHVGKR